MTKTILKSAAVAAAVALMAGCASQGATVDQAMRKAEAAQAAANQAQQTATQALQTAREAQNTANANSQRIDRMFKASQMK